MQSTKQLLTKALLTLTAFGLVGCSAPNPKPVQNHNIELLGPLFDDKHADAEVGLVGSGTIGATISSMDPAKAGWYAVDMACLGDKTVNITISGDGIALGKGEIPCGGSSYTTTTMEFPAKKISITATSDDTAAAWMVRTRPTTAPTP